ncbi:DUF2235 domain-containing protein [Labrys monachus]|uniref:Uncharacterized protein (DUF2235 family) n=1 Tax=Labrys monachus TaxID=217067 RepID=A0ABU0F9V6_9HYPH|nr:DUF2235 domain-containing protein [Labrys monachus]MDQ0390858.1 uncharacterized protein (DUF2235 family) [Labrys monachus]
MKNLIVCCDGTWNTPDEKDNGLPSPTNVVKIYNSIENNDDQIMYYHPGVGTGSSWWDHLVGGGTGEGLDQNTKSAYAWLSRHYRAGDNIFLFGFSRGAYTVRSLGGLIAHCGLLDLGDAGVDAPTGWARVADVFDAYRNKVPYKNIRGYEFHNVRPGEAVEDSTAIHFIGVWDTVGALGIPEDLAFLGLFDNAEKYRFHNTDLSPIVAHGRHAVALDERRASFAPTLWSNIGSGQDIEQIWFPGSHGDVGGGYLQSELSDRALKWMIKEASDCGLQIHAGVEDQLRSDPLGIVHDSCDGIFKFLKTKPRSTPLLQTESADLDESARIRWGTPVLRQGRYWRTIVLQPGQSATCDIFARERWNATGLFLEGGKAYRFAATGEWMDQEDKFSPAGKEPSGFHFGDVARLASSVLGSLETDYKLLTRRGNVDFWWTRRDDGRPWFALMGFVANAVTAPDSNLAAGETFFIGDGTSFAPRSSGYLYGFANDAWQAYDNNRGSVSLTVTMV